MKFLTAKVRSVGNDFLTSDAEDYMITECKKVLQVSSITNLVSMIDDGCYYTGNFLSRMLLQKSSRC